MVSTSVLGKDKYFESNYKKDKDTVISVGVFCYSKALNKASCKQEAQNALNAIYGKQFEYYIYYVIEQKEILAIGKKFYNAIATDFWTILKK